MVSKYHFRVGWVLVLILFLQACQDSPSNTEIEEEHKPPSQQARILAPSDSVTHWDDQPIDCEIMRSTQGGTVEWLIDGDPVACVDGEFADTPPAGEYNITARIITDSGSCT